MLGLALIWVGAWPAGSMLGREQQKSVSGKKRTEANKGPSSSESDCGPSSPVRKLWNKSRLAFVSIKRSFIWRDNKGQLI